MTQEEKAKRYDEIIEKTNKMHSENCETCQMCIEELIPELKEESGDERIRKELICYFKKYPSIVIGTFNTKECIAWLEKQYETFTKKDVDDAYLKGVCDAKHELEKQGKKKPIDKVEPKFRIGDVIEVKPMKCHGKIFIDKPNKIIDITEESYILDDGKAYSIELQDGWKLSEQKPAWSEEDESLRLRTIGALETCKIGSPTKCVDEQINWLKSLKDRVQPQPKQEWSEEDENTRKKIIKFLKEQNYFDGKANEFKEPYKKEYEWLKSLRPQSQWKPSEEQMDALHDAAVYVDKSMFPYPKGILMKLYKQLKKLREE